MARPRKEIDQKQFENLCGLQCTLEEICGWFDVTDKTLDSWCKRTYHASFPRYLGKSEERGRFHCVGVSGSLRQRTQAWLFGWGNSTLGSAILLSWVCRLITHRRML